MNFIKKLLMVTFVCALPVAAQAQTDVKLLVVYTDDARVASGGTANVQTQIVSAINDGNVALGNSNVDMQISIAAMREIAVNEGAFSMPALLNALTDPSDGVIDVVHQWRNQTGADLVYLVFEGIAANGQANAICGDTFPCNQSFEEHAFALGQRGVMLVAPILIHELGHVMGLRHDRTRDCGNPSVTCIGAAFPYSYGHIDPQGAPNWGTIMAGGRPFPLLDFFSNPNLNHPTTGQALGVTNFSDSARSLNNVRNVIASFRPNQIGGWRRWISAYGYDAGSWRVDRHPRLMADVDGDGRDDIVGFGNAGAYVSRSTGSGFTAPSLWVGAYGYNAGGWRVDKHPRFMADVNGDGRDDIVGFGNAGAYVSLSTGSSFTSPSLWVNSYGYTAGGWRVENHPRIMADVNGDGRDDIVGFGNAGAYVSFSTGSGFTAPSLKVSSYGYSAGGWRVENHPRIMADVNGDGRDDIVGFGNAGAYVSFSTGSGFTAPSLKVNSYGYSAGGWRVENHPRFMADVNADGRDDIVGFGNAGAYVSLSTGSGFTAPSLKVNSYGYSAGGWRVDKHPRFMADVNNDGRDDIVGFGNAGAYVSLSSGSGFSSPALWVSNYGYQAGGWKTDRHPRFLSDVTGDGRSDVVGFGNAGAYVSRSNGVNQFIQ